MATTATTRARVEVVIDAENKPENLPCFQEIIDRSFHERPGQSTATNINGVRLTLDLNKTSGNQVSDIWVKFGGTITMGEANTQRYIAQYLEANADDNPTLRVPHIYIAFTCAGVGFIVMEYINGQICDDSDFALAAAAVRTLLAIPSPTSAPGPVGGGLIEHPVFLNRTSSIWYESVKELQDHINGILRVTERKERISFGLNHDLRLCPSDLNRANFMKLEGSDTIVAIDFGGYSFLPPCFFDFALRYGGGYSRFAWRIARALNYPPYTEVGALVSASGALAPFGSNDIGLPKELRSRLHQ